MKNKIIILILVLMSFGTLYAQSSLYEKVCSEYSLKGTPSFEIEKQYYIKNDKSMSEISKILRSVSTMEGLQYYSNGDKRWETLYHRACFIDNPKDQTPLSDDTEGSADGKDFYFMQEDNSLGKCIYKIHYIETDNEIAACFLLCEPIKVAFINAVKSENLCINIVVSRNNTENNDLTVIMKVQAKYQNIPMLEDRMNRSFASRIEAIYGWFENKVNE